MSQPLTDAESTLLFDKLNRRAGLLKSLRRNPSRSLPYQIPSVALLPLFITVLMVLCIRSDSPRLALLAGTVGVMLVATIEILICVTNNRVDALIELLQQEGILDNPPTVHRENRSEGGPAEKCTG